MVFRRRSSADGLRSYEFQPPECPRRPGSLLGRWVRVLRRSFGCGQWRQLEPKPPMQPVSMPAFGAVLGLSLSRCLLGTDGVEGRPTLLYLFVATAMRTDDLAFVIFGKRQDLGECFLAGVAEKFVVGHMDLPRLVCLQTL